MTPTTPPPGGPRRPTPLPVRRKPTAKQQPMTATEQEILGDLKDPDMVVDMLSAILQGKANITTNAAGRSILKWFSQTVQNQYLHRTRGEDITTTEREILTDLKDPDMVVDMLSAILQGEANITSNAGGRSIINWFNQTMRAQYPSAFPATPPPPPGAAQTPARPAAPPAAATLFPGTIASGGGQGPQASAAVAGSAGGTAPTIENKISLRTLSRINQLVETITANGENTASAKGELLGLIAQIANFCGKAGLQFAEGVTPGQLRSYLGSAKGVLDARTSGPSLKTIEEYLDRSDTDATRVAQAPAEGGDLTRVAQKSSSPEQVLIEEIESNLAGLKDMDPDSRPVINARSELSRIASGTSELAQRAQKLLDQLPQEHGTDQTCRLVIYEPKDLENIGGLNFNQNNPASEVNMGYIADRLENPQNEPELLETLSILAGVLYHLDTANMIGRANLGLIKRRIYSSLMALNRDGSNYSRHSSTINALISALSVTYVLGHKVLDFKAKADHYAQRSRNLPRIHARNAALRRQLEELQGQVEQAQGKRGVAQSQLEVAKNRIEKLEKDLAAAKARVTELEEAVETWQEIATAEEEA